MACYRKGGCGPYEMLPCGKCPASKPEYLNRYDDPKPEPREKTNEIRINLNEGGSMKGTIISGEEVLKTITSENLENISKIYEIYPTTGSIQISPICGIYFGNVIKDCHDENIIFIKIEK